MNKQIILVDSGDNSYVPPYEVVEVNSEHVLLRIPAPGARSEDISVRTVGIILFVSCKTNNEDDVIISGSPITRTFDLDFTVDTNAKIGAPYLSDGILNIPIIFESAIFTEERTYSVMEVRREALSNIASGTSGWTFKDAHKPA